MREKLIEILGLPAIATDSDILKTATTLATERAQAKDGAAFEARLAALMRATNMPRETATKTLAEQDAATAPK